MKKSIFITILAVLVLASALPSTAYAGPGTGDCNKALKAGLDAYFDSPYDSDSNHGDAISDGFFGNEPNLLDTNTNLDLGPNEVEPGSSAGDVEASLSPGPGTVGGSWLTWGSFIRSVRSTYCPTH